MNYTSCHYNHTRDTLKCGNDFYQMLLGEAPNDPPGSMWFYIDIAVVVVIVLIGGLTSGLTMGLMSLDELNLEIIKNSGEENLRRCAEKILPLVKRHHLLLVTLLLTNAIANETLPLFLDNLLHPIAAIVISVSVVLLFGEVLPQAICSRYGLQVGANLSWLVWGMIGLLFVVAYPISKLLDFIIGTDHGVLFRRAELKELVHQHGQIQGGSLTTDEVRIIKGALDLQDKTVGKVMTPLKDVFAIDYDDMLDATLFARIISANHSRIPIFQGTKDHITGMIVTKNLLSVRTVNTPIRQLKQYRIPSVEANLPLYEMLNHFQTGRSHMAIVLDEKDRMTGVGIITLEDVIEELLQTEILDEADMSRQVGQSVASRVVKDVRLAKAFLSKSGRVGPPTPEMKDQYGRGERERESPTVVISSSYDSKRGNMFKSFQSFYPLTSDETQPLVVK